MKDRSYKISVSLAVVLHFLLFVFLFTKFVKSNHYATNSSNINIIHAVAINQPSANVKPLNKSHNQVAHNNLTPQSKTFQKPKILPKQQVIKSPAFAIKKKQLQQNLQRELLDEAMELKMARQKAAMEKSLENELASEKKVLGQNNMQQSTRGEIDKYKALILQSIAANWIIPSNIDKSATCLLLVNVAPGGVILDVKLLQGSGNLVLDRSAETAVLKTSPLPVPNDPHLFAEFRTIKLIVRPEGIATS